MRYDQLSITRTQVEVGIHNADERREIASHHLSKGARAPAGRGQCGGSSGGRGPQRSLLLCIARR
jgi:hypothetical protein